MAIGDVHTYPANDVIEHDTDGGGCLCGPMTEPVEAPDGSIGWHIIHHSLDGREFRERGEQVPQEAPDDPERKGE